MPDPDQHTELCAAIHDLLTKANADLTAARRRSLSRALLGRVVTSLGYAEEAAHEMCPEPDPRGVKP